MNQCVMMHMAALLSDGMGKSNVITESNPLYTNPNVIIKETDHSSKKKLGFHTEEDKHSHQGRNTPSLKPRGEK